MLPVCLYILLKSRDCERTRWRPSMLSAIQAKEKSWLGDVSPLIQEASWILRGYLFCWMLLLVLICIIIKSSWILWSQWRLMYVGPFTDEWSSEDLISSPHHCQIESNQRSKALFAELAHEDGDLWSNQTWLKQRSNVNFWCYSLFSRLENLIPNSSNERIFCYICLCWWALFWENQQ